MREYLLQHIEPYFLHLLVGKVRPTFLQIKDPNSNIGILCGPGINGDMLGYRITMEIENIQKVKKGSECDKFTKSFVFSIQMIHYYVIRKVLTLLILWVMYVW